jgi:hypothetical protein
MIIKPWDHHSLGSSFFKLINLWDHGGSSHVRIIAPLDHHFSHASICGIMLLEDHQTTRSLLFEINILNSSFFGIMLLLDDHLSHSSFFEMML